MSDPELIEQLQPREARFQKIDHGFFFWRRQPRNFENVTLVVRWREHFQVCFGGFF